MLNEPLTKIFISYSHKDSNFATHLAANLKAQGLNVWIDRRLRPGRVWSDELQDAIDNCQVVLVILSPDSATSKWVHREYQYAQSQEKLVIPLLCRTVPRVPIGLSDLQWIDFKENYDGGLKDLLDTLGVQERATVSLDQQTRTDTLPPSDPARRVDEGKLNWKRSRLFFVAILPIIGVTLIVVLLGVGFIRLPWYPTAIAPTSQVHSNPNCPNPNCIQDNHLAVSFRAFQSESYVIPNDPTNYSLRNLPLNIGAQVLDCPASSQPYKVVLDVRNWQQEGNPLTIQQIDLVIQRIPHMPFPLNVWRTTDPSPKYDGYPFHVTYKGQREPAALPIYSGPTPDAQRLVLSPGEQNTLEVQVVSMVEVDLQFSIRFMYHIPDDAHLHTLELPNVFEVVFANASNWHLYQLENGRFVRSSFRCNNQGLGPFAIPI